MKIRKITKKIASIIKKFFEFLGKSQFITISTIILAIATFYSTKVAMNIAFNDKQEYIVNNGFHYIYDKEQEKNYKYYSISLTNASTDKPINLTGGFSITISNRKSFSGSSKNSSVPTTDISELLNTNLFPINLKYGEEINFSLDEDFADYIKSCFPSRTKKCNRRTNTCYYAKLYIKFCLYDTLDNKYCYILTEDDISEISNFSDGRLY